jgi:antitoxin component YwqK of YwqJK toxin-antitoxin module
MDRLMVADTIPTKFVILISSLLLFSCQNKIVVTEYELIDGLEIPRYVRINEFSGTITIMYIDDVTIKSKKKYKNGLKNGRHEGWWPNGNKKYSFQFQKDMSVGEHFQWHQNGSLFTHKQYENGLEDGEQKAWDVNGDLMYKYIYNKGRKYGIQGSVVCNGGKDLAENNDHID